MSRLPQGVGIWCIYPLTLSPSWILEALNPLHFLPILHDSPRSSGWETRSQQKDAEGLCGSPECSEERAHPWQGVQQVPLKGLCHSRKGDKKRKLLHFLNYDFFMTALRKDLGWFWLYFSCMIFFFVFALFLKCLVIHVKEKASLSSHLHPCLSPFAYALLSDRMPSCSSWITMTLLVLQRPSKFSLPSILVFPCINPISFSLGRS